MFLEYINKNLITLLLLATIILMTLTNRRTGRMVKIYILVGLTFVASIAEFSEIVIDQYHLSYRLLYYKAMAVYCIYPLLTMMFLFITGKVIHRYLITVPFIVNCLITAVDTTGSGIIYWYGTDHSFHGGPLNWLPAGVEVFYVLILFFYSVRIFREKNRQKGIIVLFMAVVFILSLIMTNSFMSNEMVPSIVALEIMTYYFYISAIEYNNTQMELADSRLLLERNKINLLLAQIRPHFVNSNLAVIRSLCYDDPEKAVETIDHFSEYLRESMRQLDDSRLVYFNDEMVSVDNYLYLEKQRFQDRIEVVKEIEFTDFMVPPLSVQTIVENSIRHGISMSGVKGTVWIKTEIKSDEVIITIRDNGQGFDIGSVEFDGVKHIGLRNVKDRISRIMGGHVEIESKVGEGTRVCLCIPFENRGGRKKNEMSDRR